MSTFSLNPASPVQRQATQVSPGRGGQIGQGIAPGQQMAPTAPVDTSTMDALFKLGGEVLQPHLERRQAEEYLKGVQAVSQGESLQEIKDQQPWYTKIFGPTASIKGAQQMALVTKQDEFVGGLTDDMTELRKMDSAQFGDEVRRRQLDALTGDATTDSILLTKITEVSGPLYRQHAKEHFKYTQEMMHQSVVDMMSASAKTIRSASLSLRDGVLSEGDYAGYVVNAMANVVPMHGQTPESYWGAVEAVVQDQLAQGNHHFVAAVWDSGLIDQMPIEMRTKLIPARETAELKHLQKVGMLEYSQRIAEMLTGDMSDVDIAKGVLAINADARATHGVEADLLDRDFLTRALVGANKRRLADIRTATSDMEKELAEARYQKKLTDHVLAGKGIDHTVPKADLENNIDGHVQTAFAAGNLDAGLDLMIRNAPKGLLAPGVRNQLQAPFRMGAGSAGTEHMGTAVEHAVTIFKAMKGQEGGGYAVQQYFGDYAKPLTDYVARMDANISHQTAWDMSFGDRVVPLRNDVDKTTVDSSLSALVESVAPGKIARLFGAIEWTDDTKAVVKGLAAPHLKRYMETGLYTEEQARANALREVQATHDFVGEFVISKSKGAPALSTLTGMDDKDTAVAVQKEAARLLRESGFSTRKMEDRTEITLGDFHPIRPLLHKVQEFAGKERGYSMPTVVRDDRIDPNTGKPYAKLFISVIDDAGQHWPVELDTRYIATPAFNDAFKPTE